MRFRGGEFSTGTTGNFQPELTGEFGIRQSLIAQAQPKMGTTDPPVVGRAGAGPRKKPGGFNLTGRRFYQLTKFLPLLLDNRGC
jgi:hypothetical protein